MNFLFLKLFVFTLTDFTVPRFSKNGHAIRHPGLKLRTVRGTYSGNTRVRRGWRMKKRIGGGRGREKIQQGKDVWKVARIDACALATLRSLFSPACPPFILAVPGGCCGPTLRPLRADLPLASRYKKNPINENDQRSTWTPPFPRFVKTESDYAPPS